MTTLPINRDVDIVEVKARGAGGGGGALPVRSSVTKVPVFYLNLALITLATREGTALAGGKSAFQLPFGRFRGQATYFSTQYEDSGNLERN